MILVSKLGISAGTLATFSKSRVVLLLIAASLLSSIIATAQLQTFSISGLPEQFEINTISFTSDGKTVFITAYEDWEKQVPFVITGNTLQPFTVLDTIYNGAISPSGKRILFAIRDQEYTQIYLTKKKNDVWSAPVNLTTESGITGGYFNWLNEETVYFYVPKNQGDLVVGRLLEDELSIQASIDNLNTQHTEFSPFVDPGLGFLLFTRYKEGDPSQQGVMYSQNIGSLTSPVWDEPVKIDKITYGWGAFVLQDTLYYTDGSRIQMIPTGELAAFSQ